jgi:YgiT-type zinc finger domain-containing protein
LTRLASLMNKPTLVPESCAFCGTIGVKTIHKTKLFGKGKNALVIKNVPVRHCDTCGESYYAPEVSQIIDDILAHPEKQAVTRQISVISLAA